MAAAATVSLRAAASIVPGCPPICALWPSGRLCLTPTVPTADPAAAARRRASAMCQIAGVGEVAQQEPHPGAMQAAMGEVRSGAAFRGSAYADSVADYVQGGAAAAAN